MSSRYSRLFELAVYVMFVFAVGFRHAIVAVFAKLPIFLALGFLLSFVVGRTAQILKIIAICFLGFRVWTCAGHKAWLWGKLRMSICSSVEDPTLPPLFQRPPPIS